MTVRELLSYKGTTVVTVTPETTLADAANRLRGHAIGALVVSSDGRRVEGIISERDIIRALGADGGAVLDRPVGLYMTSDVTCVSIDETIDEVMAIMTNRRFRHLPVLEQGAMIGLISIGDAVRQRLSDLVYEAETLRSYIAGH